MSDPKPKPKPKTTKKPASQPVDKATKPASFIRAIGRRKTSVARIRLYQGKGDNLINDQSVSQYLPGEEFETEFLTPFRTVNVIGKFYVTIKVNGGGIHSQSQAIAHGITRALVKHNPELKTKLKKKDLLTRDPRMKERRKPGFAQAARARKQSPKR